LINNTAGTLYVEYASFPGDTSLRRICIGDATDAIKIGFKESNQIQGQIKDGGTTLSATSTTDITSFNKVAVRYKSGDNNMFVNGSQSTVGTFRNGTFSGFSFSNLSFDQDGAGTNAFAGRVKCLVYFQTALNYTDLGNLTN